MSLPPREILMTKFTTSGKALFKEFPYGFLSLLVRVSRRLGLDRKSVVSHGCLGNAYRASTGDSALSKNKLENPNLEDLPAALRVPIEDFLEEIQMGQTLECFQYALGSVAEYLNELNVGENIMIYQAGPHQAIFFVEQGILFDSNAGKVLEADGMARLVVKTNDLFYDAEKSEKGTMS